MEAVPPKLLDRPTAWGCLLTNLMLPGLGTIVARRRATGIAQIVLSQTGFALTLVWGVWLAVTWARLGYLPEELGPFYGCGILGALLFFSVWIWSLVVSLDILRKASDK